MGIVWIVTVAVGAMAFITGFIVGAVSERRQMRDSRELLERLHAELVEPRMIGINPNVPIPSTVTGAIRPLRRTGKLAVVPRHKDAIELDGDTREDVNADEDSFIMWLERVAKRRNAQIHPGSPPPPPPKRPTKRVWKFD